MRAALRGSPTSGGGQKCTARRARIGAHLLRRRLARDAWAALHEKLDQLRALPNEPVQVERLLLRFLERARLSVERLLPLLRQAWEAEGARETLWDAINALSWTATHGPELKDRERRVLSGVAGLLAFSESGSVSSTALSCRLDQGGYDV